MHQKPFHSGPEILPLRQARKGRFTQARIAVRVGLSLPTVRLLERGAGSQASLSKLTAALGITIEGRNLPPGPTLGPRLAALRKRRGFSQRSLAAALKLAPATVNRLENTDASSVAVLCRVLAFLGAGAYLAAEGEARPFYTHAGNASVFQRWTPPPALLRKLYAVFGIFDLDPCSPTVNRRKAPVRARMHFTEADNGLALPWHGTVFLNPPYGRPLRQWIRKPAVKSAPGEPPSSSRSFPRALIPSGGTSQSPNTPPPFYCAGGFRFRTASPPPSLPP